jgi:hypothetical protein
VVPLSTLCLWGVGRCQNWFWGRVIISRALFSMSFFWPKTPALNIPPGTVRLSVFAPETGYVQRIARGRTAGCGVVRGASRERNTAVCCNSGTGTVRTVRCDTGMIQRRHRYCLALHTCTARQNLRIKYNKRYGYVAQCFTGRCQIYNVYQTRCRGARTKEKEQEAEK